MADQKQQRDPNHATAQTEDSDAPSIVWFRNDLRLGDNPALQAARDSGRPALFVFILEQHKGLRTLGGASRWWLHHSLKSLAADLEPAGARLDLLEGDPATLVPALVASAKAGGLYANRRYGAAALALDDSVETAVACPFERFNGRLLHEPWEIKTKQGGSYGVYTPFWKAALANGDPGDPLPRPRTLHGADWPRGAPKRVSLDALDLLPSKPDWAAGLVEAWTPGERGALERLKSFLKNDLQDYPTERNNLASSGTSHLSPHLRFGEISPKTIRHDVLAAKGAAEGTKVFLSEIGWREFDYHVMHYHPDIADTNLHRAFDKMDWRIPPKRDLTAWQRGQTGFPVVDAGMRQLWQTGYMHNRVRMITASFLIKDLMADWRIGEKWFWDCLCDADPANNTMNWQWVAGCGADAAPFFRIFNPVTQGEKFDPDGDYVRRWVPELGKIKGKAIHAPWTLSAEALADAGVELGTTYPAPMLDHKKARETALAAYARIKG